VVFHIEPVAHILAVDIHRQRKALEGIENHQQNQLLGKPAGDVVVGTVRRQHGNAIGVSISRMHYTRIMYKFIPASSVLEI
jgi:hypothetical protein